MATFPSKTGTKTRRKSSTRMTRSKEQGLIIRAQSGDSTAVASLILAHQDSLYTFMLRISGRPDVAEDIVQEAFVRVIKNIERFDLKYRFSTWLFTIAKRLYVNWSQKFRPISESELVGSRQGPDVVPEVVITRVETRQCAGNMVQHGLQSLSETQREIVLLFHQQDWSINDISQYLDMPEGTIKSHLHRARRKMRSAIQTQWSTKERAGMGFVEVMTHVS